jgi:4-amino-4-deoxy-L-arabinose transferase-like glycosyltransferase
MPKSQARQIIAPLLILLLAALLRLPMMDVYPMWADEFSVQLEGIRIATEGQRPLIGTEATFQGLTHHSPFTSYLLAIPYTLFPDPGLSRVFVGLLGVLTVAIWYATVKRYFGAQAAVIAGLIIAMLPIVVYWSRFVWNPNLGLVFIPLWFYSALFAYHDGKRWAQILHWLILSANIQSQAVLIYLLPVSIALFLWHLLLHPKRLNTIIATLIGVALFAASLIPWWIGLQRYAQANPVSSENVDVGGVLSSFNLSGLRQVPLIFGRVVGATEFPSSELNWHPNPVGLWSTVPLHLLGWIVALAAIIGIIWLILRGLRAPTKNLPALLMGVMGIVPFGIILFASPEQPITDHFFMPVTFAASAAIGVLLAHFWKQARWLISAFIVLLACNYALLTGSYLWWLHQHPNDHPNGSLTALNAQAEEFLQYGDVLVMLRERILDPSLPSIDRFQAGELFWSWYVMRTRYPIQPIFEPTHTLIFPVADRVAIVGRSFSELIPSWFGDSDLVGYNDRYRILTLQPQPAAEPNQFGQVARLLGAYTDESLCEGQAGAVTLLWQPLVKQPPQDYNFSVRLVDEAENQHAQVDVPTIPRDWWQTDKQVLSHIEIPAPANPVMQMRVVLYNTADAVGVDVVDTAGNPVNYFAGMPLGCGL